MKKIELIQTLLWINRINFNNLSINKKRMIMT
jgi:hypothetical protein